MTDEKEEKKIEKFSKTIKSVILPKGEPTPQC